MSGDGAVCGEGMAQGWGGAQRVASWWDTVGTIMLGVGSEQSAGIGLVQDPARRVTVG